ncbi:MAG: cell division protein FtsB [Nitrosomonas sp.]|jgi:cell division protein FtsB|uniref:cell division protein FtsB n=1 Tax=Nitrosomonas sp. TaxID=42353 RepID=UPI0027251C01|nr:cell division protein FtsB [Nitrosomonas sp.]MDO9470720.1 cell division protein FtsB [Nitrosomonas sp.]MDP1550168.1 cell division protein FtsB [Nitrosomonas sp.]MDP1787852.1 cell division protein FtsB [Nitrosomonas sp.]MDP1934899.1 cell division protein FtsB [Nitrosomonas sp.]MDP2224087.1 cell division protein FtsB [Nitrosomonas sp.]
MRLLSFILLLLIAAMQYPLWYGKASWLKVWQVDQDVVAARENNLLLQNRNNKLEAEVNDLKQGFEAIEERARSDLGMIKEGEILFQIVRNTPSKPAQ